MAKSLGRALRDYAGLLAAVRDRIRQAQTRAVLSANAEMICLYWDVGRLLVRQQSAQGWGARVLRRLASDLRNELPEVKGFSERNLMLMTQFYREYPCGAIAQQPVAQLPWGHNVLLMAKIKDAATCLWYVNQTSTQRAKRLT